MKRLLTIGLMLAAALALTNCVDQFETPIQENDIIVEETSQTPLDKGEGIPYEVILDNAETKMAYQDGRTYWQTGIDEISLFSAPTNSTNYICHNEFLYQGDGLFAGELSQKLSDLNNWYSIYPYSGSSAVKDNTISAQITIGAPMNSEGRSIQEQKTAGSKSHIVGINYPMYGIRKNVSKNTTPRFKMSHLYSLVELVIENVGDGISNNGDAPIIIKDVEITAEEEIAGTFIVNILGDETTSDPIFTPVSGSSSKTAGLKSQDAAGINVEPRQSVTLYMAVKPFDASGKDLTVSINGSTKKVKMPANTKFEIGKKTTIRVPVKLSYPKVSDALGTQPAGYEFITWENMRSAELNVNGEKLNAYIVGEGGKAGKIIIEGTARDLINGMDVGFYASTWSGKKSAMTVSRINLWMPEYNSDGTLKKHTQIASYGPLQNAVEEIAIDVLGILGWVGWNTIGKPAFSYMLRDGIPKVKEKDTDLLTLTQFMDAANITFSNVIENSALEGATSLIMLDENPIYKEVGSAAVAKLLEEKFDHKDENNNIIIPTYEGLCHIVNGVESTKADVTANAIFGKLKSTIGSKTVSLMSSLTINVWDIFSAIFPDAATMKRIMGDLKVRVYISTCPYGTDTAYNPMIFWGLDAYGPDRSAPLVAE